MKPHLLPSLIFLFSIGVAQSKPEDAPSPHDPPPLIVRPIKANRTADGLEMVVYSLKNVTPYSLKVLVSSDGAALGLLCNEFRESSVPLMPTSKFPNTEGRGSVIEPGEERIEFVVASPECIRQRDSIDFAGELFVRYPNGLVRSMPFWTGLISY